MAELIVALDLTSIDKLNRIVAELDGLVDFFKLGIEPLTAMGFEVIEHLKTQGKRVFVDLKFFDIPKVVHGAVKNLQRYDVDMLTLHTLGGTNMLCAAVDARGDSNKPLLMGVTVLTSLSPYEAKPLFNRKLEEEVLLLTSLAYECGLDGVVASPLEVREIKSKWQDNLLVLTPGIRATGASKDDQARILTPYGAAREGADFLVVGRPILNADNPRRVVESMLSDIQRGNNEFRATIKGTGCDT